MIGDKPLHIRLDKIDGFIWVFDGSRHLVLFEAEKFDFIYNRIRYLVGVKSGITYVVSDNYAEIKIDSYDYLPLEKTLAFDNVINILSLFGIKIKITTTIVYS